MLVRISPRTDCKDNERIRNYKSIFEFLLKKVVRMAKISENNDASMLNTSILNPF
jgi:hypothetical protein